MVLLGLFVAFAGQAAIRLEAEDAKQFGTQIAHTRAGYSGSGYVTGFAAENAHIVWQFKAKSGIYRAVLGYSSPTGPKGYGLVINGAKVSAMFDQTGDVFAKASAGRIELKSGLNTIELDRGWGWFDVDYLQLTPANELLPVGKPPLKLADPKATEATRLLFSRIRKSYGQATFSGQYDQEDNRFVQKTVGVLPAIFGSDFIDYSPSRVEHGSKPGRLSEDCIQIAKAGQIVTMSWHWNAPLDLLDKEYTDPQGQKVDARWYKGFYTNATTFDVEKALSDPTSPDYRAILRDIDAIGVQLKKFSDAGVPILWRPLHEAEGGWFWWGAKGPEAFKELWKLLFARLTYYDGIHNLIWVYSSGTNPAWYPGDEYVDVVGIDAYPDDRSDPLSATWDELSGRFANRKILAITEFGGVPDVERMRRFGADWDYFVSWSGGLGAMSVPPAKLKELYTGAHVIDKRR